MVSAGVVTDICQSLQFGVSNARGRKFGSAGLQRAAEDFVWQPLGDLFRVRSGCEPPFSLPVLIAIGIKSAKSAIVASFCILIAVAAI